MPLRDPSVAGADDPVGFADNYDYLAVELRWLDLLLTRGVRNLNASASDSPGVYVTEREVIDLLGDVPPERDSVLDARLEILRADIDGGIRESHRRGVRLPLPRLADRLGLTPTERQALIICLAPELDRKYDRIYCFLQDDITRKRPSVDLVVGLIEQRSRDRWQALRLFSPHAPLRASGLLSAAVDQYSPSGSSALALMLQVAPRYVGHALGDDQLDGALAGSVRLIDPMSGPAPSDPLRRRECELTELAQSKTGAALVIYLQGGDGIGCGELAQAVAARMRRPILEADLTGLEAAGPDAATTRAEVATLLTTTLRESWLLDAPVLLTVGDAALSDPAFGASLDAALRQHPSLVFVTGQQSWPSRRIRHAALHRVALPAADRKARQAVWEAALGGTAMTVPSELVGRFRLSSAQIRSVVDELGCATGGRQPEPSQWYAACRAACDHGLDALAVKVGHLHRADELLLADEQADQLRALRDQVRYRDVVFDEWGLGSAFSDARGLTALFAGPPGTGKTMAAGVVARELGLDLYRIDLSRVVSKYIGETEKNLGRIFDAAERSTAVLFFDEADALFGKRTKVSDAHDRYANIETSYLLQRIEEYDGIVVLATNLRQNIDDAFVRRLRFVIDFPFPDKQQRLRIWQSHLGTGAPLAAELGSEFLTVIADRLPLSGGSIRNVVLCAAFRAAARGAAVDAGDLIAAAKSEFAKTGALWPDVALGAAAESVGAGR